MAMGKGYSPWSDKLMFRYGFGFGFSYAESVPIIEQIQQEKRGRNTSHFLNYMEVQIDFPVYNFTKAKSMQGCFPGLSLGAQVYTQVIFFKDLERLEYFKLGNFEFAGQAGVAVITLGAGATPAYNQGVAVFFFNDKSIHEQFSITKEVN